jgi:alpha-galactosidase
MHHKLFKRYRIIVYLVSFIFLWGICLYSCTQPAIVWLDELDLSNIDQSAGIARANQSMWRTPLIIASDTFPRGVGTHASGFIRIELDGKTKFFEALVGIDRSAPEKELKQASVEFVITGDGGILWRSGIMHANDKAKKINIPLKGIKSLILRTDHAGDGIVGDRVDWVNAKFLVAGLPPVTVKRTREPEYIQTPGEAAEPLINAPYIYGARPDHPILFTIPVSGKRPVKIVIKNLPAGLTLDPEAGFITGKIKHAGSYVMDVIATNTFGSDTRQLTFQIGETIALTPPMGWNSWNIFGANIDDRKIRDMVDAMVSLGLVNYGYSYINIDDGWQGERGGKYNAVMPNEKFPDMKGLVDYAHSKGLKTGIYSSPWVQTFAGYTGGSADSPDGKIIDPSRRIGQYSFAGNDVKQWAEWGFDYLKYDWVVNDIKSTSEMTAQLRNSGRDIIFSISNAAPFNLSEDWAKLTNAWRTTGDISDSWCSMTAIGFMQDKWQPYAAPGAWNDPDMLVVGKVGWGEEARLSRLSPDEQYIQLSLWSILAAPLLIGCDLRLMDDFTLNLLNNREVIAVNQDVAGIQGKRILQDEERMIEIWSKPLKDGSQAVGLFNLGEQEQVISVQWEQLHTKGMKKVRNLWKQEDIGVFETAFSTAVPSHGVMFVKIESLNREK